MSLFSDVHSIAVGQHAQTEVLKEVNTSLQNFNLNLEKLIEILTKEEPIVGIGAEGSVPVVRDT